MFRTSFRTAPILLLNLFVFATCALLLLSVVSQPACAQSVSLAGLQTAVNTGSYNLNGPQGVAVDGAGNLYISDTVNLRVLEVTANCAGSACTSSIGAMPSQSTGLAVDKAGDVFVIGGNCNGCGFALEIPAGCTMTSCQIPIPISGGLLLPQAIVVDAAGDLFIADTNHSRVVEVPAGCTMTSCQTTVGVGLSNVYGVAVDTAGDVFIANGSNVLKVPAGCSMSSCQTTVGSGLSLAAGVAVDVAGSVFIADFLAGDVVEVPAGGGAQNAVISGLNHPLQLALDGAGDLFVANDGNNSVVELERIAPNFGYVNVGSSSTLTLTYNINSGVTLAGTPTVLTQGAPGLDFTLSGTPTCSGALTAPTTCTVTVQFAPLAPGLRQGAVQLYDSSNNLLVTTLVRGSGSGPQVVFPGGPQVTITSGYTNPAGLALDGAGDLFVGVGANSSSDQIIEFPAGGGSPMSIANDFHYPGGMSIDGAGNLFAADQINNRVVEMRAGTFAQSIVASGLNNPSDVAVDGAGNFFIADTYNHRVLEEPAVCATNSCPVVTYYQSGSYPDGIAIDGAENLFTNDGIGSALELPAVGVVTTLATGLASPAVERVDAADDLFIVDYFNNRVLEVPFGCTDSSCQVSAGSGLQGPFGVALDGAGDLYISSGGNNQVYKVQRSQAPTLTFDPPLNSTSSPMTVAVQNIGNQPLAFTSFIASPGFSVDAGTTTCSTSTPLEVGGTCDVGVDFTAGSSFGTISGALTLTDNALNAAGATQTVPLTGKAGVTTTTLAASPNPSTGGQTVTFTATVTPAPSGSTGLGSVTFKANGTTIGTIGLLTASDGVARLNYSGLLPSGSPYSVVATYSGATELGTSSSNTISQTVTVEPTTTTLSASATTPAYGQSVTLTATVSSSNGVTPTGSVVFKNGTTTIGTVTLVKSGSGQAQAVLNISTLPVAANSITVNYAGSTLMQASSSTATTVTVGQATSTTALTSSANPSVYGQTVSFTATVTPENGGTATGTVTFYKNGASVGVLSLGGNKATLPITTLTPATDSFTATYSGSTDVGGSSTTSAISQVINKASTTTAVMSSSPTVTHGTPVTFTATVMATAPSTVVPPGSVIFYDTFNGNVIDLGVGTLSGGTATKTVTYTAAQEGSHSVTATYTGSAYVSASPASPAITQTVN